MANPDVAAALVVLQAHLVAADATLTDPLLDVDRGLLTGGRQLRYYYGGECEPPRMGGRRVLNGELVGERFIIAASWVAQGIDLATASTIDVDMQALAHQVRTRIQGDSQLGGNVTDLDLDYGTPDMLMIANVRCVVLQWQLDLAFVEYAVAA